MKEFPDLFNKNDDDKPSRDNVTIEHMTEGIIAINRATQRFASELDSWFGMVVNQEVDRQIDLLKAYKHRINDIRYELNNGTKRPRKAPKGSGSDDEA